jgi:hypothetical protein
MFGMVRKCVASALKMIASVPVAMYRLPMSEKPPLTDSEVYERLHQAFLGLLGASGETKHGDTAIRTARHILTTLQAALLKKMDATAQGDASDQQPFDPR